MGFKVGFKKYQDDVEHLVKKEWKSDYWPQKDIYLRLGEEVGEIARELNHLYGSKKKKDSEVQDKSRLEDEIHDAFFTLICLANKEGMNLDKSWPKMMMKYRTRDKGRHKKSSSSKK